MTSQMRRILLVSTLIAAMPGVEATLAAQETQAAQDTLAAQDEQAAPPAPLAQLAADLAAIAARIDEVEANLAAAPPENQAVFTFQRRRRWREHHEVLGRLVQGIEREQRRAPQDSPVTEEQDTLVSADADSVVVVEGDSVVAGADSLVVVDPLALVIAEATNALQRELVTIEAWLADVSAEATTIRRTLTVAPPTDLVQAQIELNRVRADVDALYLALTEDYGHAAVLGLGLTGEQPWSKPSRIRPITETRSRSRVWTRSRYGFESRRPRKKFSGPPRAFRRWST